MSALSIYGGHRVERIEWVRSEHVDFVAVILTVYAAAERPDVRMVSRRNDRHVFSAQGS
ncbi:MAG TPA: hypothetical protein VGB31_10150 [Myxococcota bacterium]